MRVSLSGQWPTYRWVVADNNRRAHLDTFAYIGRLSGDGSIAPSDLSDVVDFKKKVKLIFISFGEREHTTANKTNMGALQKACANRTYYESPMTRHE